MRYLPGNMIKLIPLNKKGFIIWVMLNPLSDRTIYHTDNSIHIVTRTFWILQCGLSNLKYGYFIHDRLILCVHWSRFVRNNSLCSVCSGMTEACLRRNDRRRETWRRREEDRATMYNHQSGSIDRPRIRERKRVRGV